MCSCIGVCFPAANLLKVIESDCTNGGKLVVLNPKISFNTSAKKLEERKRINSQFEGYLENIRNTLKENLNYVLEQKILLNLENISQLFYTVEDKYLELVKKQNRSLDENFPVTALPSSNTESTKCVLLDVDNNLWSKLGIENVNSSLELDTLKINKKVNGDIKAGLFIKCSSSHDFEKVIQHINEYKTMPNISRVFPEDSIRTFNIDADNKMEETVTKRINQENDSAKKNEIECVKWTKESSDFKGNSDDIFMNCLLGNIAPDFQFNFNDPFFQIPVECLTQQHIKEHVAGINNNSNNDNQGSCRKRSYFCEACGKLFRSHWSYNLHKKFHGEECDPKSKFEGNEIYSCLICAKTFQYKSSLHRHTRNNHKV